MINNEKIMMNRYVKLQKEIKMEMYRIFEKQNKKLLKN